MIATPASGELAHDLEQRVALRRRQRGGRLVHHQDARVERQRLGDLDQLLLADPQLRHAALRVDLDSEPREQPVRRLGDPSSIDDRAGDQRLAAKEDVVGRRQLRDEIELLMNDRNARPLGVLHAGELHRRAHEPDDAVVLDVNAGENLHQRRLAGAVLADQRMNLAGPEVEVDVDQGRDTAERLGDARDFEDNAIAASAQFPAGARNPRGARSGKGVSCFMHRSDVHLHADDVLYRRPWDPAAPIRSRKSSGC